MNLFGLNIVSSPYAREIRDEYRVEPNPIRKRRRNWRIVKHHIDRPAVFMINTAFLSLDGRGGPQLVAHPDVMAMLTNLGDA